MQSSTPSNVRSILLLVLAFACVVMAMKFRLERNDMQEQLRQIDTALQPTRPDPSGDSQDAAAGVAGSGRVFKLLAMIEKKDADIRELKQQIGHVPASRPTPRSSGRSGARERGAQTGRTDVESSRPLPSFASIAIGMGEQAAFLGRIDTSALDDEKLRAHVELQEGLITMRDIFVQLEGDDAFLEDAATREELLVSLHRLVLLLKRERETIYHNTGRSFGYEEEGAQEFASFITYVNEMTTTRWVANALRATEESTDTETVSE
jgi:hypothetical protein